ncbi:MAG: NADH:flavin oxidoreductase/NADH oxidase family protein [Proteobacteria bacterium]|nr:NADH:flavin oxidoreductase/NADH oxidase family protein [Pseudomonadota bacterium]
MQLNHPGKQSPRGLNRETVAPSAIPFRSELARFFNVPRALTAAEIEALVERFAGAAAVAKKAGFTGVQIHGAHGYLVSQFLSPHHNQRTDRWGGSAAKRRRFVLDVFAAIRSEVESLDTVRALADAGIDLVEISGGTYEAPAMTGVHAKESTRQREAYFLEFAEKARVAVTVPLMVTGGFRTLRGMAEAVRSGAVDLVGLARPLAIEPDLPARLLAGEDARYEVRPITTGLNVIDRTGLMEVQWYTRQLHRIGDGADPHPEESGLASFAIGLLENGWRTLRTRRLRA